MPTIKKVRNIPVITALLPQPLNLMMNGLYMKSLHQEDKEMCHLRQNSDIFLARKGRLKLSVKLIPKSLAIPKAMSVYPEKSA